MTQGEYIRMYRKKRKMTQAELALACGLAEGTIFQYEQGKRAPKAETIFKIANVLGVTAYDLQDDKLRKTNKFKAKVELIKTPSDEDWKLCRMAAMNTIWKDSRSVPSDEWKRKILAAGHSPIRVLTFYIRITDLPYWVAMHLVRHVHATPFVSSQRNDRQNMYDRGKAQQDAPVNMDWYMNAEELITIAHKRLCSQASFDTQDVVREICKQVVKQCPEFDGLLVPLCEYRGGRCSEFHPCGMAKVIE